MIFSIIIQSINKKNTIRIFNKIIKFRYIWNNQHNWQHILFFSALHRFNWITAHEWDEMTSVGKWIWIVYYGHCCCPYWWCRSFATTEANPNHCRHQTLPLNLFTVCTFCQQLWIIELDALQRLQHCYR